jgi:predicted membrane protein
MAMNIHMMLSFMLMSMNMRVNIVLMIMSMQWMKSATMIMHIRNQEANKFQLSPNPDKPVVAKRKSRFIGELNIEDLWYRFSLSFLFKSIGRPSR